MKLTAEIFFYVWQRAHHPEQARPGSAPVILRRIRFLPEDGSDPAAEEDTLYVRGQEIFTGDDEGPSCRMPPDLAGAPLLDAVSECWNEILDWDHRLCDEILGGSSFSRVMDLGRKYLAHPYVLIDRDMQVMYATRDYGRENGAALSPTVPPELVQSLLLRKDFHSAAMRSSLFYFYESLYGLTSCCKNIFLDGRYHARLLLSQPGENARLCTGEEQLFDQFSARVQQLCARDARLLRQSDADPLHQICGALFAGETVSEAALTSLQQQSGWLSTHAYAAGQLSFFSRPGWHSHLDYTLPYLASCVEAAWTSSCAVIRDEKILFVVDLTLSAAKPVSSRKTTADADDIVRPDALLMRSFCARLATLVRDNVCLAGISGVFHGLSGLAAAASQAGWALTLGRRRGTHDWYYLFDDYRMDYALHLLRTEGAACLLPHPALDALRESDAEKGTELMATLRAYFAAGMNMSEAAGLLYIHRTTFFRRMERIRQLTGIRPDNREQMLELALAMKLEE